MYTFIKCTSINVLFYYFLLLFELSFISIFDIIMIEIISYNKFLELNLIKERRLATRKYCKQPVTTNNHDVELSAISSNSAIRHP